MARELTRRRGNRDTSYAKPSEPEEETTRPRRGRRTAKADEPEEKKSSGRRGTVSKGWGSYKKTAEATKGGGFADEFKPEEGETELIKILDDGPFAVYKQHWIERGPGKKKSFNCLKDDDGNGDCPLCDDLGDSPKVQAMVNVVNMLEDPDKQKVLIWKVGALVGEILENAADTKRTSPINRSDLYWSVEKIKKGKKIDYRIQAVKADDDFQSDWDVEPLTDDEFEAFVAEGYDDSEVYFNSFEELEEVVEEMDK